MLASYTVTGSSSSCCISNPAPHKYAWEWQWKVALILGSPHTAKWDFRFLDAAWPRTSCCGDLGIKIVDRRSLYLCVYLSPSLCLSTTLQINKNKTLKKIPLITLKKTVGGKFEGKWLLQPSKQRMMVNRWKGMEIFKTTKYKCMMAYYMEGDGVARVKSILYLCLE